MKIHHIGYLVKKIDRAIAEFEKLGFSCECLSNESQIEYLTHESGSLINSLADKSHECCKYDAPIIIDNIRKIKIVFMRNDEYRIELVEPLDKSSPIYGLLKKYKNSPYHICYSTADISSEILNLEKEGWMLFESPEIAPAIHNCKVAFLMGANSGMIELVEDIKK